MDYNKQKMKHQKVVPKDNQIFLHYQKYDIDYVVEINPDPDNHQIELTFDFPDEVNLTSEQIDEITVETRKELSKAFSVGDEMLSSSDIKGL